MQDLRIADHEIVAVPAADDVATGGNGVEVVLNLGCQLVAVRFVGDKDFPVTQHMLQEDQIQGAADPDSAGLLHAMDEELEGVRGAGIDHEMRRDQV